MESIIQQEKHENPALEYVWGQFRIWDLTSGHLKNILTTWRRRVLIFVIAGAFFGIVSHYATDVVVMGFSGLPNVLAAISAICVALAAYAGSEILTGELEKNWIRARSAAEAFKSETYQYILRAKPYHVANPEKVLFQRVEQLTKSMSDLESVAITKEQEAEGLPSPVMPIEAYVAERIKSQAYDYYLPKARYYQKLIRRGKTWSYILGFGGVVLGTAGASGYSEYTAVWIAFISTASASIASYMYSNRFQYLVVSFQATANHLKMLLARWNQVDPKNRNEVSRFVNEAESAISIENSAWMTELTENKQEEEVKTVSA